MPYLLDTNVVTQLLKRSPRVVERYRRALELGAQIYFSAVVYYEIKRGLLHLGAAKQLQQLDEEFKNVLYWAPVSDATWDRAAHLWAECRRQGKPHDDDGDLLIAGQAHVLGAVVVTRNTKDFTDLQIAKRRRRPGGGRGDLNGAEGWKLFRRTAKSQRICQCPVHDMSQADEGIQLLCRCVGSNPVARSRLAESGDLKHMTQKKRIAAFLSALLLLIFINPTNLSAQNQTPAKAKPNFVLTIEDNLVSLKAKDASLIEVLEEIGRRMKIEVVAAVPEKEKITAEFNKLSLEDAIKRLTPNYSHAMISEPGGKKISKIIVLQKGGETARPIPATKAPEIKRPETVAKPTPSVKQEIVKEKAPVEPQPSFQFEFDPSQFEKRK